MMTPYPEMVKKNRKKHLIIKDEEAASCPQIEANTRTIPASYHNAVVHTLDAKVWLSGRSKTW